MAKKVRTIKAWAIITEITDKLMVDNYPNGRFWIYPTKKALIEENLPLEEDEKIIRIEIKIL